MLLAVDVGNTQTVFGLYDGPELGERWRIATEAERPGDELGALLGDFFDYGALDGISLSSTVPRLIREYEHLAERWAKAPLLVIGPGVKTGIRIQHDAPHEIGPDRIVELRRREGEVRGTRDRGRLRHVDELRRRLARGRLRRRRARAGSRGLDGRPLRARGAAAEDRLRRAAGRRSASRPQPPCSRASSTASRVRSTGSSMRSAASSASTRRRSAQAASST